MFGFSFFFGLTLPQWIINNPEAIKTGKCLLKLFAALYLSYTTLFETDMMAAVAAATAAEAAAVKAVV